jgi:two-component system catabolic regulation response regulator CreB
MNPITDITAPFGSGPSLEPGTRSLVLDNTRVRLTRLEYQFLRMLVQRPGICVPRAELVDALWGSSVEDPDLSLRCLVHRLRRRLGPAGSAHLVTHHRRGYSWAPQGEA